MKNLNNRQLRVSAPSIGFIMDKHKGFGPGFDFLRIILASSVIWFHSFVVTGRMEVLQSSSAWFYIYALMPMFFALSGFLIAASAQRLSLRNFLLNRGLRIIPALAVEICISALIIGPIFTIWSYHNYFHSPLFWHYFTNIFGWIQYKLPGVFLSLPSVGIVNLSLWTVPFEVGCYVLISMVILFKLNSRLWLIILCATSLLLLPVIAQVLGFTDTVGKTSYSPLNYLLFSRGSLLFPSFLLGALVYYFRYYIPSSKWIFVFCIMFSIIIAIFGRDNWKTFYALIAICVPILVYLTIFIGIIQIPPLPIFRHGDYSYGIYIYGYPIQQMLASLMPELHNWLLFFISSMLFTTIFAAISWHMIEKPILKQRRKFSFIGRRIAQSDRKLNSGGSYDT